MQFAGRQITRTRKTRHRERHMRRCLTCVAGKAIARGACKGRHIPIREQRPCQNAARRTSNFNPLARRLKPAGVAKYAATSAVASS